VGALQLFETTEMPDVRRIDSVPVSDEEIAGTLRNLDRRPLGMDSARDRFRISLAGVHDKTALLRLGDQWHRPQGPTPTSHILKLPIGLLRQGQMDLSDSVENEWLCLQIVEAFGLQVPRATIESFDGVQVLVVERFDREWSKDGGWLVRLPHEDLCQALGVASARKYETDGGPGIRDILEVLWQSNEPERDRAAFFQANVLFWMLGATDGHAKNFSLALHPRGRSSLAPFYDVVSAYPLVARNQLHRSELTMAMSVVGTKRQYAWERIQRRHWLATAKAARLPTSDADSILDDCASRAASVAAEVESALPGGFPASVADPVLGGLRDAAKRLV
jgi:serine/threonine-protein kinase HipA